MKKIISVIIVLALLAMSACAFALENPWAETTPEEMLTTLGYAPAIPEDAENVVALMNEADGIAELRFTIDGLEYIARMASCSVTDEIEDISGMYYEWESIEDDTVCNLPAKLMQAKDGENTVEVCIWLDVVPGIVYSLSTVQPDVNGLDLAAIAAQVYVPLQGEV